MGHEVRTGFWLVPLLGGPPALRFELPHFESVTQIGRGDTNDVQLREYKFVSRDHCRIRSNLAATGEVVLEDRSSNGTYVNGVRVGRGHSLPLRCGDKISLAKPHRRGGAVQFLLSRLAARI